MGVIAVIGGTGKVGRRVIDGLRGNQVRALARTATGAEELAEYEYVETRIADLDDFSSLESALQGAKRLFIASPYHPDQGQREQNAILAAQAAGVEHVVKISSYSAGIEPEVPISRGHKIAENALRESTMTWSVLRPDWWFDNLLMQIDTLRQGRFYFLADGAVITPIDARDLAAVAVRELLADKPYGGTLNLTGPETLSFAELAPRLSAATGKALEFVNDVSPSWEPGYADAVRKLFEHYRSRGNAPYTHSMRELLGRAPRSVDEFAREVLLPLLG